MAELPIKGTKETQFWRNSAWDYENSRFLVREPGDKLVIYDYHTQQAQHFSLAKVGLRVP